MAERSASDREGVGSTPTSGPHTANPGYAAFQLAKALATAGEHEDPDTRERAKQKALKWASVFTQMLDGSLRVGSRAPLGNVPAWATLEVVTGGFTTGALLAEGPLRNHELAIAAKQGLVTDIENRLPLNRYFLSDVGVSELCERLDQGTYEVGVPEEGALLVAAWLLDKGHAEEARELLDELAPFFSRLRFYPEPTERPLRFGSRVFIQDVDATIKNLQAIRANQSIVTQKEAIEVWTPLYDELVSLFLETVEGPPPDLAKGPDGSKLPRDDGKFQIDGGWPCKRFPGDWQSRATELMRRFERHRQESPLSSKPRHRKSSLAQLMPYLAKCVASPASLSGRDVGRIRLLLARYVVKRGLPNSKQCRSVREQQTHQAQTPQYHRVAAVVVPRLQVFPGNEGIENLALVTNAITDEESLPCGLQSGHELPGTIRRKIERCLCESIQVLVEHGLITSGDVLAKVLPQLTSGMRAAGFSDPKLRQLYAAVYRAFRRRRSLLLLDLQSQVKIEELPWVAAIERFRANNLSTQELSRQTLDEITSLALISFPQAILPNKLLQELRALAKGAEFDIPLIDELAADIFMGQFSDKFIRAAKLAAQLMRGTLYETYYGIDYDRVMQLPDSDKEGSRSWFRPRVAHGFAVLCSTRAGVSSNGYDPAVNGMIIEQQQIVTTQNLATLFTGLQLAEGLRPHLVDMARRTFEWICRRQQVKTSDWHARLVMIKNTAYAWRQMLFYLSFVSADELKDFVAWAERHLSPQHAEFQMRFRPVFEGLLAASHGSSPEPGHGNGSGPRQFLGWSKSRHWLLS
jgi:hypothetical protein